MAGDRSYQETQYPESQYLDKYGVKFLSIVSRQNVTISQGGQCSNSPVERINIVSSKSTLHIIFSQAAPSILQPMHYEYEPEHKEEKCIPANRSYQFVSISLKNTMYPEELKQSHQMDNRNINEDHKWYSCQQIAQNKEYLIPGLAMICNKVQVLLMYFEISNPEKNPERILHSQTSLELPHKIKY